MFDYFSVIAQTHISYATILFLSFATAKIQGKGKGDMTTVIKKNPELCPSPFQMCEKYLRLLQGGSESFIDVEESLQYGMSDGSMRGRGSSC